MSKFWSMLFIVWPILALGSFVVSPALGWWFPGPAMSAIGLRIDFLFYLILAVVGAVFVGTHVVLAYALWTGSKTADQKARYLHGNTKVEVIWTVIPSLILLFIAFYQMDVWAQYRIKSNIPGESTYVAEVTARQFEWRIRYPAPGKRLLPVPQPDDVYTVNDLRVPVGQPVVVNLRTEDVQHSLFFPQLRIKQDALPGKVIPVWFDVLEAGTYDMLCTELCGWGHYKMKARLVAIAPDGFAAWKDELFAAQFDDGFADESASDNSDTE